MKAVYTGLSKKGHYKFQILDNEDGAFGTIYVNKTTPTKPQNVSVDLIDSDTEEGIAALKTINDKRASWKAKVAGWKADKQAKDAKKAASTEQATTYNKHFG